jgi:hypothetical protein
MTPLARDALRLAGAEVARRRAVRRLPAVDRRAVEDLAASIAAQVADAITAAAGSEPALASALAAIYGPDRVDVTAVDVTAVDVTLSDARRRMPLKR